MMGEGTPKLTWNCKPREEETLVDQRRDDGLNE